MLNDVGFIGPVGLTTDINTRLVTVTTGLVCSINARSTHCTADLLYCVIRSTEQPI